MEPTTHQERLIALERLIIEYQDRLFRFAFFRIGSLSDAQDIVQDIFVKMFCDNARLSAVTNIQGYLFRCVSNRCNDYMRKKRRNRFSSLDAIKTKQVAEEESETQLAEFSRIEKLLSDIPPEQAEVIRMKTIDELHFTEIAEILDIPVATVKSRFKYGIDKLRSKIN